MLISAFSRSLSVAIKTLKEFFVLAFDVIADEPEQVALGQLGRIRCRLGIDRARPSGALLLEALEACVPFEVAERPEFPRLCYAGRLQRMLNELLADFFDEVLRHAPAVVINSVAAAMQTLIA